MDGVEEGLDEHLEWNFEGAGDDTGGVLEVGDSQRPRMLVIVWRFVGSLLSQCVSLPKSSFRGFMLTRKGFSCCFLGGASWVRYWDKEDGLGNWLEGDERNGLYVGACILGGFWLGGLLLLLELEGTSLAPFVSTALSGLCLRVMIFCSFFELRSIKVVYVTPVSVPVMAA